jgi:long-chain acyl-CoA synthetase
MPRNLAWDLESRSGETPDRTALIDEDGRRWSFAQLDAAASAVARRLAGTAPRGARVGLYLANSPELVVGLVASWKAGLAPIAMSGLYGPNELVGCIAKTDPAVMVADVERPGSAVLAPTELPVIPAEVLTRALAEPPSGPTRRAPEPAAEDVGLVLFTGGSTGEPKAVAITHDGSYRSMTALARGQKAGGHQVDLPYPIADPMVPPNLVLLPLFHGGGIQSLLFSWHVGRTVLLVSRFGVDRIARLVPKYRVDNLFLLPTMVYDLVRTDLQPDLSTVRKVLVSGQRLDPGLQARFEHRYGVIVISNYGSTEMGHVAGWNSRDVRDGRWKPGSVGRVYDGVEVQIRDPDGNPLPTGKIGEIWVHTTRTAGYLDGKESGGDELVRDGWVRSGDIGRLDQDRVLYLVGRVRELIKTGGFQIWPAEVEQVLREHPGVSDVAVVGLPDERLGEIPVAFVVPSAGPGDEAELIDWCRARLAHFKAIRAVRFVEALPRSEAGKVQRGVLVSGGR